MGSRRPFSHLNLHKLKLKAVWLLLEESWKFEDSTHSNDFGVAGSQIVPSLPWLRYAKNLFHDIVHAKFRRRLVGLADARDIGVRQLC